LAPTATEATKIAQNIATEYAKAESRNEH